MIKGVVACPATHHTYVLPTNIKKKTLSIERCIVLHDRICAFSKFK